MEHEHVVITRRDGLLDITLARAEKGNSLSLEMGQAIVAALRAVDDDIKLVKLSAQGPDFCTGRDSPIPGLGPKPNGELLRQAVALPPLELYDAIKAVPVPVLAVVKGRAIGAGCALACVADLTLASDDAQFQVPEMERDIPPTLVMAALVDRVPLKSLSWLVYSRETLNAQQAQAAGLVQQVVPAGALEAATARLEQTLLSNNGVALRAVKQFLTLAPDMPSQTASGLAAHVVANAISARF